MLQTVSIDSKTLLIKADVESELSHLFDYLSKIEKENKLKKLFDFADRHFKQIADFKFNREDCYNR